MRLNGKRVTLDRLQAELATAGVMVPALGVNDDDLHTYTAEGEMVDVPAAAGSVVAAHVADDLTPPAYGSDVEPLSLAAVRQVVTAHRAYVALATPTQAETVAQVRRLTRVQLALVRRLLGHEGV